MARTDPTRSLPAKRRRPYWRRRLARLVLAITIPILLLAGLELGLRLAGVGYDASFLVARGGFWESNPRFGWRFFPRSIAREPLPLRVARDKPEDGIRIVILGASAARGYPDPAFSFGRILETMLRAALPGRSIEVINTAMTAINSHVVVPIAWECRRLQPDLFIVYLGNNEVVGPYGPASSLRGFQPSHGIIRLRDGLQTTRLGQCLGRLVAGLSGATEPSQWAGMEMFARNRVPADDPRLERTYAHYRENLESICDAARAAAAPLILCTVPVNERDCPPFASVHDAALVADDMAAWQRSFDAGVALERDGRLRDALRAYQRCETIDAGFAELGYRQARILLQLGETEEARRKFARARDEDALRYRADSRLNAVVRDVARTRADRGVRLVDAAADIARDDMSPGGPPGDELFYEHVHLTIDGNDRLARLLWPEVTAALADTVDEDRWPAAPLDAAACRARLGWSDWSLNQALTALWAVINRPPFEGQALHEEFLARHLKRREALWKRGGSVDRIIDRIEKALAFRDDDPFLLAALGHLHEQAADLEAALRVDRRWVGLRPNDASAHLSLGRVLLARDDEPGAEREFAAYLELAAGRTAAYRDLARLFVRTGHLDAAREWCRRGMAAAGENAALLGATADVEMQAGRLAEAEALLDRALRIDDDHAATWLGIGTLRVTQGRLAEAVEPLRRAIEIDPYLGRAYQGLASVLQRLGRSEEATAQLETAARLEPDNVIVVEALADSRQRSGRLAEAIALRRRVLAIDPGRVSTEAALAWTLATTADPAIRDPVEALARARHAAASAKDARGLLALAAAWAASGDTERAYEVGRQAQATARQRGNNKFAERIELYLKVFRAGRPLRLSPGPAGDR